MQTTTIRELAKHDSAKSCFFHACCNHDHLTITISY